MTPIKEGTKLPDELEEDKETEDGSFINETIMEISGATHLENIEPEKYAKFMPSKRTALMKLLDHESFRYDIYKQENQTGFVTNRPLIWLSALKMYSSREDVTCRWDTKKDKHGKWTEHRIHICFNEIKHVTVSLKTTTGAFIVKGLSYRLWVDNQFQFIKEMVATIDPIPFPEVVNPTKMHGTGEKENENEEIERLWNENDKLRKAISALQEEITSKERYNADHNKIFEDKMDKIEGILTSLESICDSKIDIYKQEIEKSFIGEMAKLKQSFKSKIGKLEDKFIEVKIAWEEKSELLPTTPSDTVDNLQTQIDSIKSEIERLESEDLKVFLNIEKDENESQFEKISEALSNNEQSLLRNEVEIEKLSTQITDIIKDLQKYGEPESAQTRDRVSSRASISSISSNTSSISFDSSYPTHASVPITRTEYNTELIIVMDSNSKFIDFRKLWTTNKTKTSRCGNLNEASNVILGSIHYANLKYVLINAGVNDTDENSGVAVFNRITQLIDKIQERYPEVKIVLSEITPRKYERDTEVITCNKLIGQLAKINQSIFVAKHRNLRDDEGSFLYDDKHIKKNCIGRFASNLKNALRKAYGMSERYNQYNRYDDHYEREDYSYNWDVSDNISFQLV